MSRREYTVDISSVSSSEDDYDIEHEQEYEEEYDSEYYLSDDQDTNTSRSSTPPPISEVELEIPLSEEEKQILLQLANKKKPTIEEMEAEYEQFLAEERLKEEAREREIISEITAWVEKGNTVTGETLEDHYQDMLKQKREKVEQYLEEVKRREENERQLRLREAEKKRKEQEKYMRKVSKEKDRAKFNRPNAKGKLQGQKTIKKVETPEQKKEETKIEVIIKPKMVVKLEDIIGDDLPESHDDEEEEESLIATAVKDFVKEIPKEIVKEKPREIIKEKPRDIKPKEEWQVHQTKQQKKDVGRKTGFEMLAKQSTEQPHLSCTRLCNSVLDGSNCNHGIRCRFAHSIHQLVRKDCVFGVSCKYVCREVKGSYRNRHGEKVCTFWHPEETDTSYGARMGVKQSTPRVAEPVKLTLKPAPQPVVIRVSKEMAKSAMDMAVARGLTNFRIDII